MSTVSTRLMTAEEYLVSPDLGYPTELVRGEIVRLPQPNIEHGQICLNVGASLRTHVKAHKLGRVVSNDSGFVAERDPDTVRGPDVAYNSYERIPRGSDLRRFPETAPEIVIEVRSPSDRPGRIDRKVAECLAAGGHAICVLDPMARTATIHTPSAPPRVLGADATLTFADLPGWSAVVAELLDTD